jgi:co-chaperonin GroES (HSP10)
MVFVPLNKHLLIEEIDLSEKKESLVSLPEDYVKKSGERYCTARFVCHAGDCISLYEELFDSTGDVVLVVEKSMIEEVIIRDNKYSIVHQNYVVGVMEEI